MAKVNAIASPDLSRLQPLRWYFTRWWNICRVGFIIIIHFKSLVSDVGNVFWIVGGMKYISMDVVLWC